MRRSYFGRPSASPEIGRRGQLAQAVRRTLNGSARCSGRLRHFRRSISGDFGVRDWSTRRSPPDASAGLIRSELERTEQVSGSREVDAYDLDPNQVRLGKTFGIHERRGREQMSKLRSQSPARRRARD